MTSTEKLVKFSTVSDGNMAFSIDCSDDVINSRKKFLDKNGININETTLVRVSYNTKDFCKYKKVTSEHKSKGMFENNIFEADALVTCDTNHALFLPLADCVGAAIFDIKKQILMLSHLGRHSIEQNGGYKSIKYLVENFDCNPRDIEIYLSPAPGKENYPMFAFNNRSIKEVVIDQFLAAGIIEKNIYNNPIDNTLDSRYFSHSEFLKNKRDHDGRYAIVAMMRN